MFLRVWHIYWSTHQKDSNLSWTTLTPMCPEPSVVFSPHNFQMDPPLHLGCVAWLVCTYHPLETSIPLLMKGESRTNNICEGWTNAFEKLVGHAHPTIWRAIHSIQKDQAQVATALLCDLCGEPPAKHVRRHTHKLESKLHKLCTDRLDYSKTVPYLLKGIGHCVRFK